MITKIDQTAFLKRLPSKKTWLDVVGREMVTDKIMKSLADQERSLRSDMQLRKLGANKIRKGQINLTVEQSKTVDKLFH